MNRKSTRAHRKSRKGMRKSRKALRKSRKSTRRMNRRFFGGFFQAPNYGQTGGPSTVAPVIISGPATGPNEIPVAKETAYKLNTKNVGGPKVGKVSK